MQRLLIVVGAVLVLAACDSPASSAGDISAVYTDIGASGFIDQTVTFGNSTNDAVIPTVRYEALDAQGSPIPGIEVETAFGSDRSLLVVPPSGYFDVLTFSGERANDVVDVDIEIMSVAPLSGYELDQRAEPEPLAANGTPLTKFDVFTHVALTNPSKRDAYFRVVCLLYDAPQPGQSQQSHDISVAVDTTRVPAGERIAVPVTEAFARRTAELRFGCDSLKLHPTPPPSP